MEEFANIISQYGFPIFCTLILFKSLEKERETHKAEIDKTTEALNNNTVALTRLCERLGGGVDEIGGKADISGKG